VDGHPDQVDLSYHEGLNRPGASRYGATTPTLLKWFGSHNSAHEYANQVKPFNFLNSFQARPQFELSDANQFAIPKRGRPRKQLVVRPVAPFEKDMRKAAQLAFDRETGNPIAAQQLMSYREALAQYHLRPESKFLNGDYVDRGRTERRHVVATQIVHIGKESNRWEQRYFVGDDDDEDAEIEYGIDEGASALDAAVRGLCEKIGQRAAAKQLGVSRTALRRALNSGADAMSRSTRARVIREFGK